MKNAEKKIIKTILNYDRSCGKGTRSAALTLCLFRAGGGRTRILLSYATSANDKVFPETLPDAVADALALRQRFDTCNILRVSHPHRANQSTPPRSHAIRDMRGNVLASGKNLSLLFAYSRRQPAPASAVEIQPSTPYASTGKALLVVRWGSPVYAHCCIPFQSVVVLEQMLARSRTLKRTDLKGDLS